MHLIGRVLDHQHGRLVRSGRNYQPSIMPLCSTGLRKQSAVPDLWRCSSTSRDTAAALPPRAQRRNRATNRRNADIVGRVYVSSLRSPTPPRRLSDVSSTTRTGGSSGSAWRTSITRSVVCPSGIVSPGTHFGATVVNDGGSAGAPTAVSRRNVHVIRLSFRGAGRHVEDIARLLD